MLPPVIEQIIIGSATMAAGFSVYRFLPKRKHPW
jgi:hypothetical protein